MNNPTRVYVAVVLVVVVMLAGYAVVNGEEAPQFDGGTIPETPPVVVYMPMIYRGIYCDRLNGWFNCSEEGLPWEPKAAGE